MVLIPKNNHINLIWFNFELNVSKVPCKLKLKVSIRRHRVQNRLDDSIVWNRLMSRNQVNSRICVVFDIEWGIEFYIEWLLSIIQSDLALESWFMNMTFPAWIVSFLLTWPQYALWTIAYGWYGCRYLQWWAMRRFYPWWPCPNLFCGLPISTNALVMELTTLTNDHVMWWLSGPPIKCITNHILISG